MAEANWYQDPEYPGYMRYYDGANWTDRRRPQESPGVVATSTNGPKIQATFSTVTSFVVLSTRKNTRASGTYEQLQTLYKKSQTHTALFGFWGFPFGIIWSIIALSKNAKTMNQVRAYASSHSSATTVAPGAQSAGGAGWYTDPSGQHARRYYDGTAWTEHVQ